MKLRMRTKLVLSMVLISAGLTVSSFLLVRRSVQAQVRKSIVADLNNSVSTFQNFQQEREVTLSHLADLLADLPNLRALMTTRDVTTIQDSSADLWQLAGSDLFVLTDESGKVVTLHTSAAGFTAEMAQGAITTAAAQNVSNRWWFGGQHLYQVFQKPIFFGPAAENHLLGYLVLGYDIDDGVTSKVRRIAASQVAFYYGDHLVRSTLDPSREAELSQHQVPHGTSGVSQPEEVQLGEERFLATSLDLAPGNRPPVRLYVLKSLDQATAFLDGLNRLLLAVGLTAVLGGSALIFFLSHTFTRPLGNLVNGVRALERGDFHYALDERGTDEAAEVTRAFNRMRATLQRTQQELLESERLATIGRMASSISHDLRHSLAAIVANAEFLCESRLSNEQREELYHEVRVAVNQMTELIDSLLEFSRTRESLRPSFGSIRDSVDRAVTAVRAHPHFHSAKISISQTGSAQGWFDSRKLERAFFNLLLNACEALPEHGGEIVVELSERLDRIQIRLQDNGRGVPDSIRDRMFEPFISQGKENGTGLGLTVVHKLIHDHGGEILLESTSSAGTVFLITLPVGSASNSNAAGEVRLDIPPLVRAKRESME
ncbi:MAG TPA: ATP-binding protein [Terriglobales bacterium]